MSVAEKEMISVAPPTVEDKLRRLVPYRPGKPIEEVERELGITGIIKLASNENPLGPSPKAVAKMQQVALKMHLYPDANSYKLRDAVSTMLNVEPECLVFGNGSDDIIHLLGVTFLTPGDEIIQGDPSFVRYEAAAHLNDAKVNLVSLDENWNYDLDAMAAKINDRTRLIFLANPNNPTGTMATQNEIEAFLAKVPERVIVVLDEAYYEYAADSPDYPDSLRYVREGRNVVVMRTFSKAYALAGLRIGFGVMRPEIAEWLDRTREPFNVNLMAQEVAIAALEDTDHTAQTLALNRKGKREFYRAFTEMGLSYTPTFGNFVWFDTGKDCKEVFNALLHEGVITRTGDVFGAPTHLRVTIGTEAENTKFLTALRKFV